MIRPAFAISLIGLLLATGSARASSLLESVVIQPSSVYSPVEIFDLYKVHLGRELTDRTASQIADSLQRKYEQDGYTRPGYRVLDAGLESGVVRIRLVEAQFSRVTLTGDAGPYQQRLQNLVEQFPVFTSIRPQDVREIASRVRRFPGLEVGIATEADPLRSGAYVLNINTVYKPYQSKITLSNRGTEEIGRELLLARLSGNGLLGLNNTSGLFAATAKDAQKYNSFGAFTNATVGSAGTRLQLQLSSTSVQILADDVPLEQGRQLALLTFAQPLSSSTAREWTATGALEFDNLDIRQDGDISREDRLRSLKVGVRSTRRQSNRLWQWDVDIEQGLNIFGSKLETFATAEDLRESDFTIARVHYLQLLRFNETWTLRSDGYAQYSAQVLPSIKQFKVGGNRIGRGFEAAAVSGDRGAGVKLELKRILHAQPSWFRIGGIYGFYDLGAAWRNDQGGRQSAASAGIGIAMNGNVLAGYLELAKPLTHVDVDGNKDAAIFVELSFTF